MDRSACTEEVQKAHEAALLDVGNKLVKPPSSIDELLSLLTRAEVLLSHVPQICSCHKVIRSIEVAIRPAMQALISDEIFKHPDINIQVAVASCISEIVRITIQDYPYTDDQMKEIFQLFMVAFKQLSCESGKNYERALRILETVAELRSCLIMLDLDIEIDTMVAEMFQLFLDTIRPNHSSYIFNHMKKIMIMIVQESDEISAELLMPLLSSVKMDNTNTSSRSWDLGKSVIVNCATRLQHHVREAVKAKNLNVADYAEIVASLCHDAPIGNDTVANEVVARVQVANEEIQEVTSVQVANEEVTTVNDVKTVHFVATDSSGDGVSKLDERSRAGQETQMQVQRSRRGIKPNTVMRPEEGYRRAQLGGGSGSSRAYYYSDNEEDSVLPSEPKNANMPSDSSGKEINSVKKVSIGKRDQSKMQESMTSHDRKDENEITSQKHESGDVVDKVVESPKPAKAMHSKAKEKCSNMRKKTTKRVIVGSITIGAKKEQLNHVASDSESKDENEITPRKHESADVVEKEVESPMPKPTKAKQFKVEEKGSKKEKKITKGVVMQSRTDGAEKAKVSKGNANETTSKKHVSGDVVDEVVESPMSKPAKAKQSEVKERGYNKQKKATKSIVVRSSNIGAEKEKVGHSAADSIAKDGNEITPQKLESADVVENVVESLMSKPAIAKQSKVEEKGSKKRKKTTKNGASLVGAGKEKVSHSVVDPKGEDENEVSCQKHKSVDVVDKKGESPMSKPEITKQCKVKEKGSNKQKNTTESSVVLSCTIGAEKEKVSNGASVSDGKGENENTFQKLESADVVEKAVESPMSKPAKAKQSKVKEKGSNKRKRTTTSVVQSWALGVGKEKVSHSATAPESELEKNDSADVVDKVVESPASKPAKAEHAGDLDSEKEKEPMDFCLEYGRELVNLRIMVWWPIDQTYYTGTVESFDPVTKKHKIKYDDDEEEILDMSEERWELFSEIQSRQAQSSCKQEADSSPAVEPGKNQKMATKRKAGPSKKEHAGPSSERCQIKKCRP